MSLYFDVINFIWPALILFQLIVTIIAVQRIGGIGAWLMLAGTTLTMIHSGYYIVQRLLDQQPTYTGELETSYILLRFVSIFAQLLFLIGLLKIVSLQVMADDEPISQTSN